MIIHGGTQEQVFIFLDGWFIHLDFSHWNSKKKNVNKIIIIFLFLLRRDISSDLANVLQLFTWTQGCLTRTWWSKIRHRSRWPHKTRCPNMNITQFVCTGKEEQQILQVSSGKFFTYPLCVLKRFYSQAKVIIHWQHIQQDPTLLFLSHFCIFYRLNDVTWNAFLRNPLWRYS